MPKGVEDLYMWLCRHFWFGFIIDVRGEERVFQAVVFVVALAGSESEAWVYL